ncbi:excitatory amino acid transporter 5 [Tupaia chinensis]|uniref:excitatory amino acid transporter 5 n=1 Tax=Tupaia chinensis TaxID=246437 RepID=UPI0003C91734|nr:excitatory amino acid transporter 5 [Tupaia chinensis]
MEWCRVPCPQARLTMVLHAILARGRDVCRRNGLLILSVLSVTIGCLLGFFLRTRRLSQQLGAHAVGSQFLQDDLLPLQDGLLPLPYPKPWDQAEGPPALRGPHVPVLTKLAATKPQSPPPRAPAAASQFVLSRLWGLSTAQRESVRSFIILMSGLASLDAKTSSRLGILTVSYYLWTTFVAVIVGIIMVSAIHPGGAAQKETLEQNGKPIMSSADALLDLIRNMFPANLVEATFKQYRTKTTPVVKSPKVPAEEAFPRRILIYGVQEENGSRVQNFALDLTPPPEVIYKSEPGTSEGMNVLGIVFFSATMGIMLGRMGNNGIPLVSFCQCLNESVMKIVAVAVWYFPFGIVFLIAGKILEMDDPRAVGKKLGFYSITVVCGLVVHGLFILPLLYFFITKKNPIVFIRGILQALLIALATSSSSATLPITFKCLLENNHIDRRIARFVLPVGATINMDGTALYEAVAAIFIAQVNNYDLDFGQLITISITATAASIGAAGIPQAGLVTMVIVLTSVGLPTDDITLIIAVDWALDRFRTMINVLGDALAAGIMAHICRKDFARNMAAEKLLPCETQPVSLQEIVSTQQNGCVKSIAGASELTLGPTCPHHIPVQVEQDEELGAASLDHCTIEISELETNV